MSHADQREDTRGRRMARIWHRYLPAPGAAALHLPVLRTVQQQDAPAIAAFSHQAFLGGPDAASETELLQKLAAILQGVTAV